MKEQIPHIGNFEPDTLKEKATKIAELELLLRSEALRGKELRRVRRTVAVLKAEYKREDSGYIGRKIPEDVRNAVVERDSSRDFGRPEHSCLESGPPHHIVHFNEFKDTGENPHTVDNIEAPCSDCHKLAHALGIESGCSIEEFFRSISEEKWLEIESAWNNHEPIRHLGDEEYIMDKAA